MKELKTLEQLMEMAISIEKTIRIKYPMMPSVDFSPKIDDDDGCYGIANNVVSFVHNHTLYVIPYSPSVMRILTGNGFTAKEICVPFSNGEYPVDQMTKWNHLLKHAEKQHKANFVKACEKECDLLGIKPISNVLFKKCLQIPNYGLTVKQINKCKTYMPVIANTVFDCSVSEKLGLYTVKNDVCIFVYRNGKTYITKSKEVICNLHENGYREAVLDVPLCNGEVIFDHESAHKWELVSQSF